MSIINVSKTWFKSLEFIGLVLLGFLTIIVGAVVSRANMRLGSSVEPISTHFFNTAQAETPACVEGGCGSAGGDPCGCWADADGDGLGDCTPMCQVSTNDGDCGYSGCGSCGPCGFSCAE